MDERPTILPDGDWAWPDTEQPREGGYDAWTKPAGPTELTLEMPIPDYARPLGDLAGVLRDHFDGVKQEFSAKLDQGIRRQLDEADLFDHRTNYLQTALDRVREVVDGLHPLDPKPEYNLYVVWFCKTLQNWKALVGSTLADGMYYEVTYDGDKGRTYVDAYHKVDQSVIYDKVTHTDETMQKVYAALRETGLSDARIVDAVMGMQNAGILFRERDN